jgi:hypothetical protein
VDFRGTTPPLRLDHLSQLIDDVGIIQFANGAVPDPGSGYCVDDVSRLAIVAAGLLRLGAGGESAHRWLDRSLRFLGEAIRVRGLHNFRSCGGDWLDSPSIGDHVGRAIWAAGVVSAEPRCWPMARVRAAQLLDRLGPALGPAQRTEYWPRVDAYSVLGYAPAQRLTEIAPRLRRLRQALHEYSSNEPSWYWFEPRLTYDNARLPLAMLVGARAIGDAEVATQALRALDWYADHLGIGEGILRCVGHRGRHWTDPPGWPDDGGEQPIDAAACVEAFTEAWRYTGEQRYAQRALIAFDWFFGHNRAGQPLYVDADGGCQDGFTGRKVNQNQGAESTLAYYQALIAVVGAGIVYAPLNAR